MTNSRRAIEANELLSEVWCSTYIENFIDSVVYILNADSQNISDEVNSKILTLVDNYGTLFIHECINILEDLLSSDINSKALISELNEFKDSLIRFKA